MARRPPLVSVRPRVGSALEQVQTDQNNNMADLVHDWAEAFKNMVRQSEEGEEK